jgi:predicted DNA-binding ribbon-helix-helix protein
MSQDLKKRSVVIAGHRTSLSLEDAFWQLLKILAAERRLSINALIEEIDTTRTGNLSSAVRTYLLLQALSRQPGETV